MIESIFPDAEKSLDFNLVLSEGLSQTLDA
jgi:hypothetical protein